MAIGPKLSIRDVLPFGRYQGYTGHRLQAAASTHQKSRGKWDKIDVKPLFGSSANELIARSASAFRHGSLIV